MILHRKMFSASASVFATAALVAVQAIDMGPTYGKDYAGAGEFASRGAATTLRAMVLCDSHSRITLSGCAGLERGGGGVRECATTFVPKPAHVVAQHN